MSLLMSRDSLLGITIITGIYVILMIMCISRLVCAQRLSFGWKWILVQSIPILVLAMVLIHLKKIILQPYMGYGEAPSLPLMSYLILLVPLIGFWLWAYIQTEGWRRQNIMTSSIQEGFDRLDTGVCYYEEDGRVLLQNVSMTALVLELTRSRDRDGNELWAAAQEKAYYKNSEADEKGGELCLLHMEDGRWIQFRRAEISLGTSAVREITASDVSEQIRLNEQLNRRNQELEENNRWLRGYFSRIDEVVRDQEILDTRIRIHDEFGKLLLLTRQSIEDKENKNLRGEVISMWEQNAVILSAGVKEQEEKRTGRDAHQMAMKSLRQAAELSGHRPSFAGNAVEPEGELKLTDTQIHEIYQIAMHECMTNTILHGNGRQLGIFVEETGEEHYRITIVNDGAIPKKPITEGGGLKGLRRKIEERGGTLEYLYEDRFGICVNI